MASSSCARSNGSIRRFASIGDAELAILHCFAGQRTHLVEFGRRVCADGATEHVDTWRRGAYERGNVRRDAVLHQCFEPFVERMPSDVVLDISLLAEGLGTHVVGERAHAHRYRYARDQRNIAVLAILSPVMANPSCGQPVASQIYADRAYFAGTGAEHTAGFSYIVAGCGHTGIVNILTYTTTKYADRAVYGVVGGLHLFPAKDDQLDWTGDEFKQFKVANLLGAHCTGIEAVYRLRERAGLTRNRPS
jgi:hypothetical protein